jgi:VIT1/CCC1 family predicted Fe2+/Mn2+ transporter
MKWTIPSDNIIKPASGLVTALALSGILRQAGFYNFTAREAEGLNVLIQLVGDIYAVLLAFAIFVIWGQFTEVENCVIREGDSLADILRMSAYLNAEDRATIRRSMAAYAHQVVQYEWQSLGDGMRDEQADEFFSRFLNTVVEVNPQSEAEGLIHTRLLDLAARIREYHDERVAKTLTRIPPTLAGLVKTIAGVLLLLIFVYPFHHWLAGISCIIVVAVVLFLANFVMMDTDNPLKGAWNVSSEPFSDLRL